MRNLEVLKHIVYTFIYLKNVDDIRRRGLIFKTMLYLYMRKVNYINNELFTRVSQIYELNAYRVPIFNTNVYKYVIFTKFSRRFACNTACDGRL